MNWTQTQAKNVPISIKNPYLAGISLVAGNFLIFQVALRIANHIDPRHNYIISSRNRTSVELNGAFFVPYVLGLVALTMMVKVPFSRWTAAALHTAAFVGSIFFTFRCLNS